MILVELISETWLIFSSLQTCSLALHGLVTSIISMFSVSDAPRGQREGLGGDTRSPALLAGRRHVRGGGARRLRAGRTLHARHGREHCQETSAASHARPLRRDQSACLGPRG